MIKECPVILNNDAVTVVKFDGTDIQLPSIERDVKTVNVKFDNGKYSIVNDIDDTKNKDEFISASKPIEIDVEKKAKKTIKKKVENKDTEK